MDHHFARAVDPLFVACLDLLDRAESNRAEAAPFEKQRIRDAIQRTSNEFRTSPHLRDRDEDWTIARYAICVWLDELLSLFPWKGKEQWTEQNLQYELFRTSTGYEDFFRRAQDAEKLPRKDALEVCFLCVTMGFQGVYHRRPGMRTPEDLGLPAKLQDWVRDVRRYVDASRPPSPSNDRAADGIDCTPLSGRFEFLKTCLAAAMLAVAAGVLYYLKST